MNYQPVVAGNQPNSSAGIQEHFDAGKARKGNVQQCVLFLLWSTSSKDPQNNDADTTFEVKKPESEVHVSLSRVRKLIKEFEDFTDNSTNEVNAASTLVLAVGKNLTNSTNTFSAVGPSNIVVSLTLRESLYVDPSQYPGDPDMPALEDITYSNDEEDVGAEADFTNLETTITVSPILTTRVHRDHIVSQIISDLSFGSLTRSMTRMVTDEVSAGNQPNASAGVQDHFDAEKAGEENVQQYVLFPSCSSGSKDPQNIDDDTTFKVKENEFKVEKPESEVHVSPSSSTKTKKHDDKTKREAKGKILAVGKNLTNSTNTFSAVGPSNIVVSLTLRESLYVDPSQYPGDPDMPALEDITYSNDEEDVGAEADFTNLETTITVSPILTTRVHRDHIVSQIIGDLSFGSLTRSMTRMVTDEGGLT
nr:hypothetical protein [Tanacetum cinerariifolium]